MTATLTAPASPSLARVHQAWADLARALYVAQRAAARLCDLLDADGAPEGRLSPSDMTAAELRYAAGSVEWDAGAKADLLASDLPHEHYATVPLAWRLHEARVEGGG